MTVYPELKDRVAIVTGASMGIGAAVARALGAQGCKVAVNYRRHASEAETLTAAITAAGGQAKAFACDVADSTQVQAMVDQVKAHFGGLDILVNNAGINRDGVSWKMTDEQWDTVIATNLKGCFNFVRAAAPQFREKKSGRIVNMTSINGMRGKFGQINYSASKAGIIGLTKSLARELGASNVNVNAVAPGLIETDMVATMPEEAKAKSMAETVLGRLGSPDDVAAVVVFLCSNGARHITGEVIKVDGGQYI
ncbi:MAG: beta-ketoacyl-ACP reductase [candidate division Zixibacteria bacterium]|nr:beta-ketoacyl-ACP reductase [candidate division Zixibacteria bacterium]